MKLTQIYSNIELQKINFNKKFNVVFAKVNNPKDNTKDSHNLGKSTLISLIDFLLLKELSSEHFLKKNFDKFRNHIFYMEIENNSGEHLTIKRSVLDNTKVSFHVHEKPYSLLLDYKNWENEDLPIRKAKKYLNDFLDFDVLSSDYSYRDTVNYFLRNQYDYRDVFQLERNLKNKDIDWKPVLFKLIGFPETDLKKKYSKEIQRDHLQNAVRQLESKNVFDQDEKDKILGIIQVKEIEKADLREQIDNFNFILSEKKIKKEVVEEIENKVSQLNSFDYDLSMEEERVLRSISQKTSFQIEECKRVFNEANLHFPKELLASYDDLVKFHQDITSERDILLNKRLKKIKEQRKDVEQQLSSLNEKRIEYLGFIRTGDTFKKYKEYEKQIELISNEIFELKKEIGNLNSIDVLNKEIKKLDNEIDELKDKILEAIGSGQNSFYNNFRAVFTQIVKNILGVPAILSLKINKTGNVEFHVDVQRKDELTLTDEGKGNSYKKVLCAAFDLTLLSIYSRKSFFRFVYHDGVLEGMDNRMKTRFIECVRQLINKYDFQYILSVIEHDIPISNESSKPLFEENEIAVRLSDEGVNGKLLRMNF